MPPVKREERTARTPTPDLLGALTQAAADLDENYRWLCCVCKDPGRLLKAYDAASKALTAVTRATRGR